MDPDLFGGEAGPGKPSDEGGLPADVPGLQGHHRLGAPVADRGGQEVLPRLVADEGAVGVDLALPGRHRPGGGEPLDLAAARVEGADLEPDHVPGLPADHRGGHGHRGDGVGHHGHRHPRLGRAGAGHEGGATRRHRRHQPLRSDPEDRRSGAPPGHGVGARVVERRPAPGGEAHPLTRHQAGDPGRHRDARRGAGEHRHLDGLDVGPGPGDGRDDPHRKSTGIHRGDHPRRVDAPLSVGAPEKADRGVGEGPARRVERDGGEPERVELGDDGPRRGERDPGDGARRHGGEGGRLRGGGLLEHQCRQGERSEGHWMSGER